MTGSAAIAAAMDEIEEGHRRIAFVSGPLDTTPGAERHAGFVAECEAAGVPRAVSVVGFDDHLLADLLDPPLSVVDRDMENQGAVAMRMLLARLSGEVTGPGRTVRLDTRLIRRSSTGGRGTP